MFCERSAIQKQSWLIKITYWWIQSVMNSAVRTGKIKQNQVNWNDMYYFLFFDYIIIIFFYG